MLVKPKKIRIECLRKLVEIPFEEPPPFNWRTVTAVRGALSRLSEKEREIVEQFHFCGSSCAEIGALLKLPQSRVYTILKEGRRKLKATLGAFVQKRYGIPAETDFCQICLSPDRETIEKLLLTKTKEETWKRILRKLEHKYQLRINPRSLSRHLKRHLKPQGKKLAANIS